MRFSTLPILALAIVAALQAGRVTYTYDSAGRITAADYGNGTVIRYGYDTAGNITSRTVTTSASGAALAMVSAASFSGISAAPGSLVTGFGQRLATGTASTPSTSLPDNLAGTTIVVKDAAGAERNAGLVAVSPGQVNFLVPAATQPGLATVTVTSGDGARTSSSLLIERIAPGLFSANASGRGLAAAFALRVTADGTQSTEPIVQLDSTGRVVATPVDLGPEGHQVFLLLFGTGIRGVRGLADVKVSIGGTTVPVVFAGDQSQFPGLDQVNVGPLPRSLAGRGELNIALTVEERRSNVVSVALK